MKKHGKPTHEGMEAKNGASELSSGMTSSDKRFAQA